MTPTLSPVTPTPPTTTVSAPSAPACWIGLIGARSGPGAVSGLVRSAVACRSTASSVRKASQWWPTEFITDDDVNTLIDRAGPEGVDVLVCHDAPIPPNGVRRLAAEDLAGACQHSNDQIARAVDAVQPSLLLHGHYHRHDRRNVHRPWGDYKIVAIASDQEAGDFYGGSWCILELPTLHTLTRRDL
jgi:hypothetical protein